jgi:hypothetical protein
VKTPEDVRKLRAILTEHFLFKDLDSDSIESVVNKFSLVHCPRGLKIYVEKQVAKNFYVMKQGTAQAKANTVVMT